MKRRIPGLSQATLPTSEVPDGMYLVQVDRVQYRWDKQKPHYKIQFAIIEPEQFANTSLFARLYCTAKALWKLSWFLRDFGYDIDLLGRDELDERRLVGLRGVVKVSHTTINGRTYINLDAFTPAGEWEEFATVPPAADLPGTKPEVA